MVRSVEELFAIEQMAAQGMSIQKIAETLGVPLRTTTRWLQRSEGEMVPHNVGRPRGAEAGLCPVIFCSLDRCVFYAFFFSGSSDNIRSALVPHH